MILHHNATHLTPSVFLKKFYVWETDAEKVCKLIRNTPTTYRVILKTKDETYLLEKFIQHYKNFLSLPTDILIFDNNSTRSETLNIYTKYNDNFTLIKYSAPHNDIHHIQKFLDLYKAIWDSSTFYSFFDTDELLFFYNTEDSTLSNDNIIDILNKSYDVSFFTTFWLKNVYFSENKFFFDDRIDYIRYIASTGKPIINSRRIKNLISGFNTYVVHTLHLPVSALEKSPCCFLLLHMSTLTKGQRIRTDMNKLVQYGFIGNNKDFKTIIMTDNNSIQNLNCRYYVREIKTLLAMQDTDEYQIEKNYFEVVEEGGVKTLHFHPESMKKAFNKYINKVFSFVDFLICQM
jgi:hypothetical protein